MSRATRADNEYVVVHMAWLALAAGWLIGSISLYVYLVRTAREPRFEDCMDCDLPECTSCPILTGSREVSLRHAA